ncbi:MAG: S8 family serine peptidase [Fimbriimonadaceae bacterium]|nr:S8 family serine peptidase [Fimbriimonadaceae bacterium]QYK55368.1 MAG: S8 family serine peptidase [Fimbriimonadaceae bacterium]
MRKSLTLLALSSLCGLALAGTGSLNRLSFTEQPGVAEFSGQMIVKPLSLETLQRLGKNVIEAEAIRRSAEVMINTETVRHLEVVDFYVVNLPRGEDENSYAQRLMKTGKFEYVEPDWRVYPQFTPNDPRLGSQWSHTNNQSTEAWDIFRGNAAVTVAITDTGVHKFHEDFNNPSSRFVPGYNAVNGIPEANGGAVQDINGHGTHCAGISAAWGNNGLGVAGVNIEGTKIMPVRVSNSSGGSSNISWLTGGALWAAQNGARIISTSYSGFFSAAVNTTGNTIRNTYNGVWFWAAGNDGAFRDGSVDWVNVVIVGNLQSNNTRAGDSAFGPAIDLFAPGSSIWSTVWSSDNQINTYANFSGTSMASPYAAGVAAMILGSNPNLSGDRVEEILEKTCIFNGDPNTFGWGRSNLWNAMGRKPGSVQVFRGNLIGGDVRSLDRVEGNSFNVNKGITVNQAEAPVQIITEHPAAFTSTAGEVYVTVTGRVNVTGVLRQRIQLFNWNTGQYDNVNEGSIGTSFGVFEGRQTANVANYVSGGTVRVRTQVFPAGPVSSNNWGTQFDQINVRVLRAGEAS